MKPTRWMSNSPELLKQLGNRCEHWHGHCNAYINARILMQRSIQRVPFMFNFRQSTRNMGPDSAESCGAICMEHELPPTDGTTNTVRPLSKWASEEALQVHAPFGTLNRTSIHLFTCSAVCVYLVNTSAGFKIPFMRTRVNAPRRILSWIQRHVVSICRSFHKPCLPPIPCAAALSVRTFKVACTPTSFIMASMPNPILAPFTTP